MFKYVNITVTCILFFFNRCCLCELRGNGSKWKTDPVASALFSFLLFLAVRVWQCLLRLLIVSGDRMFPGLISSPSSSLLLLHLPDFLAQCCKFFGVFVYVCLSLSRDRRYNLAESRGPREHSRTEQCRWGNEIYMFVSVILTGVCKSTKEKTGGKYRENCVLCIWDDWCMEVVEVKRGHVCLMLTHCFSALAILSVFLFYVRFQLPSLCTWIHNVQCYL